MLAEFCTNFTPSTTPLTADSNTKILITPNFDIPYISDPYSNPITDSSGLSKQIINNNTYLNNESKYGGAIYSMGECNIVKDIFDKNKALFEGGAIYIFEGILSLELSIFINNNQIIRNETYDVSNRFSFSIFNTNLVGRKIK